MITRPGRADLARIVPMQFDQVEPESVRTLTGKSLARIRLRARARVFNGD
jgi:hypothetical protein